MLLYFIVICYCQIIHGLDTNRCHDRLVGLTQILSINIDNMPLIPHLVILDDAFDAYLSDDDDNNNDTHLVVIDDEGRGRCSTLNNYLDELNGIDGHQKKKRWMERTYDNDMNHEDDVAMESHL